MEKIRLGLIGCGGMMKSHVSTINKVDGAIVSAVCDIDIAVAEDVASALPHKPYVTWDYRTMLDHVDAVLVALPHDLHYECGMYFALNKKHVLMEKPLCNSEEECIKLIETCEEEGVTLMCAYPVRFWPGVVKLKELVDSGEYGKVIQMSIWTEQYTKFPEISWVNSARVGGGQFFSHGCHYVDIFLWFLGEPVKGSHFGTKVGTPWMMREGTSTAIFKFESGAVGYHGATWGARGTNLGYCFQIHTEKAMLEYNHSKGTLRVYQGLGEHKPGEVHDKFESELVWERTASGKESHYEISHFIDCVKTGKTPLTNGWDSLQSLRVIWKMYDAEKHDEVADLKGLGFGKNK